MSIPNRKKKAGSDNPPEDKRMATRAKRSPKVPLDETAVEFDDDRIDEALSDAREAAHRDARRATQGKYL